MAPFHYATKAAVAVNGDPVRSRPFQTCEHLDLQHFAVVFQFTLCDEEPSAPALDIMREAMGFQFVLCDWEPSAPSGPSGPTALVFAVTADN